MSTRLFLVLPILALAAAAQDPETVPPVHQPRQPNIVDSMPAIAQALGVGCNYCHVARHGMRVPEPKKDIARAMMAMTRDLNLKIQDATGKPAGDATEVQCVTCHRGVAIPGQLIDILLKTAAENGTAAAIAQYRELRARYYGRQSYDFGEGTLRALARRVGYRDAGEEIAVLQVNLEFNPKSVLSYSQLATAYSRNRDDKDAIQCLQKALEIEPRNSMIQGQLAQLKSYKRNQQ